LKNLQVNLEMSARRHFGVREQSSRF